MPDDALCRHCVKNKRCRPKGLCFACSRKPEVRALYPSTSKFAPKAATASGAHETAEQVEAMVAEQMADLPAWWDESERNSGYGKYRAGPTPRKPSQADPPRLPRRSRRAGKK